MHVWRMSLLRTKSTIISWDGSCFFCSEYWSFFRFHNFIFSLKTSFFESTSKTHDLKDKLFNLAVLTSYFFCEVVQYLRWNEPHYEKICLYRMRSLISAFVVPCLDSIMPMLAKSKTLANFCSWEGWFESYLVETSEDRFSRDMAQIHWDCK